MSIDTDLLDASLRRLAAQKPSHGDLPTLIHHVATSCVALLGVTGSGIMLVDEMNVPQYLTASDGQGRLLEKVEARTLQGPCTDAFVLDTVITTPDLRTEERWPVFRAELADEPELRAVLGVPIKLGAIPVGTLDLFLDRPHEWSDQEQEAVLRFVDVVESILSSAVTAHAAGEKAAQLQYALDYRIVIDRGVGFLMARDRLDAVTAFNLLRSAARNHRTKVGQVAHRLLETGRLPDEA